MSTPGDFDIFLVATPGLERSLCEEALERGFAGAKVTEGGVALRGGWPDIVPGVVAAGFALVLARRWQKPRASGKVAPKSPGKRPRHLRIVDGREHYYN